MNTSPMITTDEAAAPGWWTDVQQDRSDLTGDRQVESWLDEEIDFVPQRTRSRRATAPRSRSSEPTRRASAGSAGSGRFKRTAAESRVLEALGDMADGVDTDFSRAPSRRRADADRAGSFDVVIGEDGTLTPALSLDDALSDFSRSGEIILSVPAAVERPTVRITGRPGQNSEGRGLRRGERTLLEMIGPHPDRIAFWVVLLGLTLILLSVLSAHA